MKIIIAGAYAIGTYLAKLLSRNDQDIVLIDDDEERLSNISSDYDLMTVHASPSSVKALKDAGIQNAALFIGVTPDENLNMNSCMLAKALGAKKTVAKISNHELTAPDLTDFFKNMGINSLIYPENLAAQDITNGLKMSWVRQRWEVHNSALIMLGIKLREACCREDSVHSRKASPHRARSRPYQHACSACRQRWQSTGYPQSHLLYCECCGPQWQPLS